MFHRCYFDSATFLSLPFLDIYRRENRARVVAHWSCFECNKYQYLRDKYENNPALLNFLYDKTKLLAQGKKKQLTVNGEYYIGINVDGGAQLKGK